MSSEEAGEEARPLACPRCARRYPLDERFCGDCGMPLVYVGRTEEHPVTARQERARKIKPSYTGGRQVRVATAGNLAEAELIQGLLLEEGIPSFLKRTRGFDVPDFLAAGPREILVPEAGADAAREILAQTPVGEQAQAGSQASEGTRPVPLLVAIVGVLVVAVVLTWLLYQATG